MAEIQNFQNTEVWVQSLLENYSDIMNKDEIELWRSVIKDSTSSDDISTLDLFVHSIWSESESKALKNLRFEYLKTVVTMPVVGIIYNLQTFVDFKISNYMFVTASLIAAISNIYFLVEQNRKLILTDYYAKRGERQLNLFVKEYIPNLENKYSISDFFNGNVVHEYYMEREKAIKKSQEQVSIG